MNTKTKTIICILLIIFFLSIPVCSYLLKNGHKNHEELPTGTEIKEYAYDKNKTFKITVEDKSENKISENNIVEYIANQIIKDGAAYYHDEAVKAVALTVYTDMVYDGITAREAKIHPNAFLCTDCIYCNDISAPKNQIPEEQKTRLYSLISEILSETVTYKGKTVQGIRTPVSSGKTENASDIYGRESEYLKSKESFWDLRCKDFEREYTFKISDFYETAVKTWGVDGNPSENRIEITESTDTGNIKKINVYGKEISGDAFCSVYGIISLNFTVVSDNGEVKVSAKGIGNSVGLSIYGANILANQGYSYKEIIKYYYTGVQIEDFDFSSVFS